MFHVTYDITTPESAEQSDSAESGFLDSDGWKIPMNGICGEAAGRIKAQCDMSLRDALNHVGVFDSGSDGRSYYEADGRQDYRTGSETRHALHLSDKVTGSSMARVARVLQSRGLT